MVATVRIAAAAKTFVFGQAESPYTFIRAMILYMSFKVLLPWGNMGVHLTYGCLDPHESDAQTTSLSTVSFLPDSWLRAQADRQTSLPRH